MSKRNPSMPIAAQDPSKRRPRGRARGVFDIEGIATAAEIFVAAEVVASTR